MYALQPTQILKPDTKPDRTQLSYIQTHRVLWSLFWCTCMMATNVSVQPNGEPILDIILLILARSNRLSTSGTYPPQDDIFWYELQLLLSEVFPVIFRIWVTSCREDCLVCFLSTKAIKSVSKRFPTYRRVTQRQLVTTMRHFME